MSTNRNEVRIKPKAGLIVRDPITLKPLEATGELKPRTPYWIRRIKDGDVELIDGAATEGSTKTKSTGK